MLASEQILESYEQNHDSFTLLCVFELLRAMRYDRICWATKRLCTHQSCWFVRRDIMLLGTCYSHHDGPRLWLRSRAPDGARIDCSMPRMRDGNFDPNINLLSRNPHVDHSFPLVCRAHSCVPPLERDYNLNHAQIFVHGNHFWREAFAGIYPAWQSSLAATGISLRKTCLLIISG